MIIKPKRTSQQTLGIKDFKSLEPHNPDHPIGHDEPDQECVLILSGGEAHWVDPEGLTYSASEQRSPLCGSSDLNPDTVRLSDFRAELWSLIQNWPTTKLKGMAGVINQLCWHWANCFGAVKKVWRAVGEALKLVPINCDRGIVQEALRTPASLNTSISSTVDYLKRFWSGSGAASSRPTVKRYTTELKEMELLDYQSEFQSVGRARNRHYTFLDIPRLLILAELLIDRLQELDVAMPSHWGQFMGWLYDAVFLGWGWRRKGCSEIQEPDNEDSTDLLRAEASHAARAESENTSPQRISFRSALRHLDSLSQLWEKRRSQSLLRMLQAARQWAVRRCKNDLDHVAVGEVCPMIVKTGQK